uniref:Uncharacterized protein n=1 Tax=Tetraselmis sp. GSL018 TaxID=582737 RepID=A0A061R818_9CHLO|mmetsp:Transcript_34108/g.80913  ORF Transcript_34108/g.80913 Transcript_34108/m.80913 type:complete len:666 (-) Transcript_34108:63-2060(-)
MILRANFLVSSCRAFSFALRGGSADTSLTWSNEIWWAKSLSHCFTSSSQLSSYTLSSHGQPWRKQTANLNRVKAQQVRVSPNILKERALLVSKLQELITTPSARNRLQGLGPEAETSAKSGVCELAASLRDAAIRDGTSAVIEAARSQTGSWQQGLLSAALAMAIRAMPNAAAAEEAFVASAKDGLLRPADCSRAAADVLKKYGSGATPWQVILAMSRLIGRGPSCCAQGQAQPSNASLQTVMAAAGEIGDAALVWALWEDLSCSLVHSSRPSRASARSFLAAATRCDLQEAARNRTSAVWQALGPGSYARRAAAELQANWQRGRSVTLPAPLAAELLRLCQSPEELDSLLYSPLLEPLAGEEEDTPPVEDSTGGPEAPSIAPGWVPPAIRGQVAAAAIEALGRHSLFSAAWHTAWKAERLSPGDPRPWMALARANARAGNSAGVRRALDQLWTSGAPIPSRAATLLLLSTRTLETLLGAWRSPLVDRTPREWRTLIACVAQRGGSASDLRGATLEAFRHCRKAHPVGGAEVRRLACSAVAACMRMEGRSWRQRLAALRQVLAALEAERCLLHGGERPLQAALTAAAATPHAALRREGVLAAIVEAFAAAGVLPGPRSIEALTAHSPHWPHQQLRPALEGAAEEIGGLASLELCLERLAVARCAG